MELQGEGIEVPSAWEKLERRIEGGCILVLGGVDTGKSTFVRWLASRLEKKAGAVGWLDGDVGQSTLGLPGTLNLALESEGSSGLRRFFVGASSPRGHMLPLLVGMQKLSEASRASRCRTLLVDTDGLVAASAGGGALKEWMIELLRPHMVVALQRNEELEHILTPLRLRRGVELHLLSSVPQVRTRSPEERARRRQSLYKTYFATAHRLSLDSSSLPVYAPEKAEPGRLLSFQDDDGFSPGIGLLTGRRGEALEILTPWQGPSPSALRFGDVRLDPQTWEETA